MQNHSYALRMCAGLGHRVHLPVATRPGQVHSYLLIANLTSFYQSSGVSPFSQEVFPGVHARAVKLSCFYFVYCDLVADRTLSYVPSRWDHMYALLKHVLTACIRIRRCQKVVLMMLAPPLPQR